MVTSGGPSALSADEVPRAPSVLASTWQRLLACAALRACARALIKELGPLNQLIQSMWPKG